MFSENELTLASHLILQRLVPNAPKTSTFSKPSPHLPCLRLLVSQHSLSLSLLHYSFYHLVHFRLKALFALWHSC